SPAAAAIKGLNRCSHRRPTPNHLTASTCRGETIKDVCEYGTVLCVLADRIACQLTVPRTSRCSEYVLRKPCNEETKLWPGSQRPSGHHPVQHSRRPTTRHRAPLPHREMPLRQAPERREASRWTTGRISDYLRRDQKMIRQAR